MANLQRPLPLFNYLEIESTLKAFHRFAQIVGKIKLATVPPRNHWWHVTLLMTPRGLTTGPMPVGKVDFPDTFELEFDLINHRLKGSDSWGHTFIFSLQDLTVADFYKTLQQELRSMGISIPIHPVPYKITPAIPFHEDHQHQYSLSTLMTNYFDTLRFADYHLKVFASNYIGKESPSQFFWHSLDLAMTRFNGRMASNPPPRSKDEVAYEAYSHEVISFGYWGGNDDFKEAAFYSYTWPAPKNLTQMNLFPREAYWHQMPTGPLAILKYDDARRANEPGESVHSFYESAYAAGCRTANWPRHGLIESEVGKIVR